MDFQLGFIATYVVTYIICSLYCVVLYLRVSSDVGRDIEVSFFRRMLWALAIYGVVESIWAVGNYGYSDAINRWSIELSVVNHIMVMGICYYWFCYVEAHLHSAVVDRLPLRILCTIPLALAIVVTASSPWTGWVFGWENGQVTRGTFYLPVLVVTYLYPIVATVRVIAAGLRTSNLTERRELLIMALFALPPAIAGVADAILPMLPIVAPAFFFSLLVIFTSLQEGQISHDALTDLNNRRRADQYFDDELAHASPEDPFYYFVIDGDSFKAINDTYGHLEGDRALRAIAEGIKRACHGRNVMAARWGGDEFVVMGAASDVGDPEAFASSVSTCLEAECRAQSLAYPLSVSVGWARATSPDASKGALVEEADNMLYRVKASLSHSA